MGLTKQQKTMVLVLLAGALLAVLNQTLLTPALPTIMDHLNVSATTVQWLTSGYALTEAVIIPLNAYFLGRFSTRRLFVGGIGLFTVGSVLCACAPNFAFLLFGRICQAAATGVVMPTVFTLILLIFPREQRGSAMGVIGLIISFAPAVGPSISGVLVDSIGWRALFVLIAILAAFVVVLSARVLKSFEGFERTTFDVLSVVLSAAGMICLLWGLSSFSSASNVAVPLLCMVAGVAIIGLFVRRQLRLDVPILSVRVLKHREFFVAVVAVTVLEAILIGSSVILPMFVQNALGESATVSGLLMLPGALLGAVCGLAAGRIFDRFGIRGVTLAASAVLIAGIAGYFSFSAHASLIMVGVFYTVACIGLQSLITPVNAWGMNSLPNASVPHGNAIVSTMEQVGSSFGTAFVVSLTALSSLFVSVDAGADAQSYVGCHIAFAGILVLAVLVGLIALVFMRDRLKESESGSVGAPADDSEGTPGIDRPWLVADIMNAHPQTLKESASVSDAIALMQESETSGLPIVREDGTVAAFISDGDILKRLARHNTSRNTGERYIMLLDAESMQDRLHDALGLSVLELATKNVVSVDAQDAAEDALRTLSERRIKKVPVLSHGVFVGTLSRRNIMKALSIMEGAVSRRH